MELRGLEPRRFAAKNGPEVQRLFFHVVTRAFGVLRLRLGVLRDGTVLPPGAQASDWIHVPLIGFLGVPPKLRTATGDHKRSHHFLSVNPSQPCTPGQILDAIALLTQASAFGLKS